MACDGARVILLREGTWSAVELATGKVAWQGPGPDYVTWPAVFTLLGVLVPGRQASWERAADRQHQFDLERDRSAEIRRDAPGLAALRFSPDPPIVILGDGSRRC